MEDPIFEEVWRVKDALARECGFDVERLFDALQSLTAAEEKAGRCILHSAEELRRYVLAEEERRQSNPLALNEKPEKPGK